MGVRGLFATDVEICAELGVPVKIGRAAIHSLDHNPQSRFPKKNPLWGGRRYWPAVLAWLNATNGMLEPDAARVAPENRTARPPRPPLRTTWPAMMRSGTDDLPYPPPPATKEGRNG